MAANTASAQKRKKVRKNISDAVAHIHASFNNTIVLITSGYLAALALRWRRVMRRGAARLALVGAAALGAVFLVIKGAEYADKAAQGIGYDTHPFFMFYYLLTGFHAAHVAAGIVLLLLVAWRTSTERISRWAPPSGTWSI